MLFVWGRAVLFADINSLPVVAPNWGQVRIGAYLRGERDKRYYGNLFSERDYLSKFRYLMMAPIKKTIHYNPTLFKIDPSSLETQKSYFHLFIFDKIPHWSDYFIDLKEHQAFIKQRLISSIREPVFEAIYNRPTPQIGIHIRMGDFKKLQPGDDFTKLGNVRTPISWHIRVLSTIREVAGYDVPATIFSDGHDDELSEILKLPNVSRPPAASALSDLLTLSRSRLLITSAGSTFSSWASYLGQCPTIWHPAHFHSGVFPDDISQSVFEGGFDPESMTAPDLLTRNIKFTFEKSYV